MIPEEWSASSGHPLAAASTSDELEELASEADSAEAQTASKQTFCRTILGLPKFTWALLCDVLALALVLLCVPLLLTCSRRRPPGAPLFEFHCGQSQLDDPKKGVLQ